MHQAENSKTNLIRTSKEIIELMISILNPREALSLYDPVCGTGGFLSQSFRVNSNLKIHGSEVNYKVAQIAQMNQIMNGDFDANIKAENCFSQLNNNLSYDLIIADLPLSGIHFDEIDRLSEIWNIKFPRRTKGFGAFVLFSLSKLSPNGKAVFTVSDSFLFKTGIEQRVRKILLDLDYIEAIISLPNGALKPYTNGKSSILVLNKNKENFLKRKVKFIVASNVFEASNLDINEILNIYHQNIENNYSQIVNLEDINKINTLDPSYYTYDFFEIRKLLVSGNAAYLSELITTKSGTKLQNKTDLITESGIPFIRIENLEREILDMQLSEKSIKDYVSYKPYYNRHIIDKECLLLAKIGENLKPTYFKPDPQGMEEIILHPNVIAIFPKNNQHLSLEFLYYQFYSDIVQNQIKNRLSRSIVPFITLAKLRELIIPYVDIHSQSRFIEVEKAAIISAEKTRIDERFKRLGYKEEAEERELNVVRTITHQLRHNLSGIEIMMDKLNRISTKRELFNYKEYDEDDPILITKEGFETPENNSVQEIIDRALKKARTLNVILLDVEKAINLNMTYSQVELLSIFQKIKDEFRNDCFTIEVIGIPVDIEISKTHFEDLINTLLDNAREHGFDKSKNDNKITFKIKPDFNRDIVEIEYQNNGKPLNITQKEYTSILTKSIDSNGSGIGGYYINKIIEAHHGSLNIKEDLKKGMRLTIELPLKQPEYE
ncbi:N-6 DNA methylase [Antarcticibacterium sp. 1MA-6-2]|uniref:N-6 DNA methylase n=1 Tax=Antarcticibacterium sp. 1MA-6-2 TaxID=2908210 RepID=UPI001F45D3CF|nr:N-6 DNA methylase [Antarcticibacterium sp. 1MA-6-2]UJH92999.1 N-6 DNA methylase [Antarcticibacterium sp. 1MA-6-2]